MSPLLPGQTSKAACPLPAGSGLSGFGRGIWKCGHQAAGRALRRSTRSRHSTVHYDHARRRSFAVGGVEPMSD